MKRKNSISKDKSGAENSPSSNSSAENSEKTANPGAGKKMDVAPFGFHLFFQHNPVSSIIFDKESLEIVEANQAAVESYGFSQEEFQSLSITELSGEEGSFDKRSSCEDSGEGQGILDFGVQNHLRKNRTLLKIKAQGYELDYRQRNCVLVFLKEITHETGHREGLAEAESKFVAAQKIAQIGYWEIRFTDQAVFWSKEVFRVLGIDSESFTPTVDNVLEAIHVEDKERYKKVHSKAIAEGRDDYSLEFRVNLPEGGSRWLNEKGRLIKDAHGKLLRLEGTLQDITERKEEVEALYLQQSRVRGILNSQTNYIARTDLQGRYTFCNEKYIEDFGWLYENENLLGEMAMQSIKDYHQRRVRESVIRCLNEQRVHQVEIDKPTRDGGVKTTLWDFVCINDSEGKPLELQFVGVDISERVAAEKSLKESNTRYELVSRATSDIIWDSDLVTGRRYWGEGYTTFFGYDLKTLKETADFWESRLHPGDAARVKQSIDAAFENGEETWKADYRFRKADGTYAHVTDRGFIERDPDGQAIRLVGAMRDVTEKRKLEKLLRNASRLSRIGSFDYNVASKELYWSSMTREIHEVAEDYVPSLDKWLDFLSEEDAGGMQEIFRNAVKSRSSFDLDLELTTAKGNSRWIRVMADPVMEGGECVQLSGSLQDIDKIKRAEQEKRRAFEEKERILESIEDGFFALDEASKVTYWNNKATEITGVPKEEVLDRSIFDVFPELVENEYLANHQKAVISNQRRQFEIFMKTFGKWHEATIYPLPKGVSVYFRDINEKKKGELQLLELNDNLRKYTDELVSANKNLEQFSFIVSHNLRAPVANILGLSDLIADESYPAEMRHGLYQELVENVKRMDTVIKDLNSILKIKNERGERKEMLRLSDLVEAVQFSIRRWMEQEEVQLVTDFSDAPEFHTVHAYIYSIFYNFISNSIKYRRPEVPPVIKISTERKDDKVLLKFKDNGLGIDLDKKGDQLFGLYKRFHSHVDGKGMGLFMVKTQVEMLGGKIQVSSEVNKGTEFCLEFDKEIINEYAENE